MYLQMYTFYDKQYDILTIKLPYILERLNYIKNFLLTILWNVGSRKVERRKRLNLYFKIFSPETHD